MEKPPKEKFLESIGLPKDATENDMLYTVNEDEAKILGPTDQEFNALLNSLPIEKQGEIESKLAPETVASETVFPNIGHVGYKMEGGKAFALFEPPHLTPFSSDIEGCVRGLFSMTAKLNTPDLSEHEKVLFSDVRDKIGLIVKHLVQMEQETSPKD